MKSIYLSLFIAIGFLLTPNAFADEPRAKPPASVEKLDKPSRWFTRIGLVDAPYSTGAAIAVNGQAVPGSSVSIKNSTAMTFDIGYDVTDNFSIMLMAGTPPKPAIVGEGAVASLGPLGSVRYGPVVLSGVYRFEERGGFQAYAGLGAAYAVIIEEHDAAVKQLQVHDNWGIALQAGAEYRLDRTWSVFADVKKIWLSVDADGFLASGDPVKADVQLDPLLISAGVKFRFH